MFQLKQFTTDLPQHVAVQEGDLQQLYQRLHDQLHALQLLPSHFPATWLSSFLFPAKSNLIQLLIQFAGKR